MTIEGWFVVFFAVAFVTEFIAVLVARFLSRTDHESERQRMIRQAERNALPQPRLAWKFSGPTASVSHVWDGEWEDEEMNEGDKLIWAAVYGAGVALRMRDQFQMGNGYSETARERAMADAATVANWELEMRNEREIDDANWPAWVSSKEVEQ